MPKPKPPVESKVSWASSVAGLFGLLAAYVVANPDQFDWCPLWIKGLVLAGGTYFGTRIAGFQAPHTPRADVADVNGEYPATVTHTAKHVGTATVKVVADTSDFVAAIDAAKAHVDQLTEAVPVPAPFTGDTPSPYTGGDVVQDPDAPKKRSHTKKATS